MPITVAGNATIDGGTITLPSWGGTITVLSGTATIGSALAGGGLAETGTGTLVLDGTLSYAGTTLVTGGTLDLLSPLAAAPVLAGGQAIGPGCALQRQRHVVVRPGPRHVQPRAKPVRRSVHRPRRT